MIPMTVPDTELGGVYKERDETKSIFSKTSLNQRSFCYLNAFPICSLGKINRSG